jgi:hypothetical protein
MNSFYASPSISGRGLTRVAFIAAMVLLVASLAQAQTTATMTSPADGSTVSGTITISASINGSYATVVFWRDNWVQIGQSSSPQFSYNTGQIPNGSHQFFVSVLDSAGNTLCASNIVTVSVQSPGTTTATMTSPTNGASISGTITISASISGPYATVVFWRDNWVQIGQSSSPQLSFNTSTLSSGSHQFFVSVLDSAGTTLCASNIVTVTVQSSGPLPTPPSNATEYTNLQNPSGNPGVWTVCDGSCSGSGGTGSSSLSFGVASPSRSGASMQQTATGSFWDTMYYRPLGCPTSGCGAVQNMLVDLWFYPQSTNNLQQLEFDPDLINATYAYFGSVACQLIGTDAGHWQLWDEANGNWVATTYPCTASTIAAGTWHHLQLYVTFSTANLNYAYQTLVFDGTTVFQNLGQTFGAKLEPTWTTNEVNIEQQIDNNNNVGASTTVNYDSYNLWVW